MAAFFGRLTDYQIFRDAQLPDPSYAGLHRPFHKWPRLQAGLYKDVAPLADSHGQPVKISEYLDVTRSGSVMS